MSNPQTVRDLFQVSREAWLDSARHTARKLLASRTAITIEDVLEVCPRPQYIHRNTTGHVFKDEMFTHVGFTKAKKITSNGRVIGVWSLSDNYENINEEDCEV